MSTVDEALADMGLTVATAPAGLVSWPLLLFRSLSVPLAGPASLFMCAHHNLAASATFLRAIGAGITSETTSVV